MPQNRLNVFIFLTLFFYTSATWSVIYVDSEIYDDSKKLHTPLEKKDPNFLASQLASIITLSNVEKESIHKHLDSFLTDNELNKPKYDKQRDNILNLALMKAVQKDNKDENKSLVFDRFESFIEKQNIPYPSKMDQAKQLRKILVESQGKPYHFLKRAEESFTGKELSQVIVGAFKGSNGFIHTDEVLIAMLKSMAKGQIDQDYLYEIIERFIRFQDPYNPTVNKKYAKDYTEVLKEAAKYFDGDHIRSEMYIDNDTLACTFVSPAYKKTNEYNLQKYQKLGYTQLSKFKKFQDYIKSSLHRLQQLLELGIPIDKPCKDGRTPLEKVRTIKDEGLVEFESSSNKSISPEQDCYKSHILNTCVVSEILDIVESQFKEHDKFEKLKKESSTVKTHSSGETTSKGCAVGLLSLRVKNSINRLTQKLTLNVISNSGKSFILKAKDRESLLQKINQLSPQSKESTD